MDTRTPIKLQIQKMELVKGNYEGYDYYKIIAVTAEGFKLSTKLTEFEYKTLMESLQ